MGAPGERAAVHRAHLSEPRSTRAGRRLVRTRGLVRVRHSAGGTPGTSRTTAAWLRAGVGRDLDLAGPQAVHQTLDALRADATSLENLALGSSSHVDRLESTGILT